jgi:hypothetical protein
LFRDEKNILERIGMGERNPDFQWLSRRYALDGERIVESEMALVLGVGSECSEHDKAYSKAAGNHGDILSARKTFGYAR